MATSRGQLLSASVGEILDRFNLADDSGAPFDPSHLPGRRALRGEPAPEVLLRSRFKSTGEIRWSLVTATPVLGDDGRVALFVSCFRDITERKYGEDAARFLAAAKP